MSRDRNIKSRMVAKTLFLELYILDRGSVSTSGLASDLNKIYKKNNWSFKVKFIGQSLRLYKSLFDKKDYFSYGSHFMVYFKSK